MYGPISTRKNVASSYLGAIIVAAGVLVWRRAHEAKVAVPFAESRAYCFGHIQEATTDAPFRVEEHMQLTRTRGQIEGTKSGTQSGPGLSSGFTGTMKGEAKDGYLEFIYSYTIDGANQKEFEVYTIDGPNLVKQRYTLDMAKKDGEDILIPNLSSTPTQIVYIAEECK